ncbi:LysR family transcriptional regulator [Burkholderia sp. R-69980]|jgi:Transcriptional regulator|nr:LysR family transcriptional regulator [Burkholderia sp. R-69980]MCI0152029.1 LysR family transcriptional regulator [Paraburkholderia sediminicola]
MTPLNLRTVDLNLLTVFDAIHQTRNMSRAAERLGMSQPAISHALGRLRLTLNDPLFVRTGGAMQPTTRAEQIAGPIRSILDSVAGILRPPSGFDFVGAKRRFNLAPGDYGACVLLPGLCRRFAETGAAPVLNILDISGSKAEDALRVGSLDLLLSFYPITERGFHSEVILRDSLAIIAREGHPEMRNDLSIEAYCALRHVILEWPQGKGMKPGEQALYEAALRRTEFVLVHSAMHIPAILASTDAIATLPTRLCRHFAETHNLRLWSPDILRAQAPLYLNWHRSQDDDAGHVWLRGLIVDICHRI